MKYTAEVKAQAVAEAKKGTSLVEIQRTIGPNPRAVMRYLKAVGIDYNTMREEQKKAGILKAPVKTSGKPGLGTVGPEQNKPVIPKALGNVGPAKTVTK
jgi:transposase-like protein